ncbi:unnamed protein product, partial [marine sediment metagenome]
RESEGTGKGKKQQKRGGLNTNMLMATRKDKRTINSGT